MKSTLKTLVWSALGALLCSAPFAAMELINRRAYAEEFPFMLFFVMWINFFAILAILLPLGVGIWQAKRGQSQPAADAGNPRLSTILSVSLLAMIVIPAVLDGLGWLPLTQWLNGPDPLEFYLPGWIFNMIIFFLPVTSGVIASRQIARNLAAGGKWYAHPVLWVIALGLALLFAIGLAGLIADQWPCFMGVWGCD